MSALPETQKTIHTKKGKIRTHKRFPFMLVLVTVIAVFIFIRAFGVLEKRSDARSLNKAYQEELVSLADKERRLAKELQDLQTPEGIEREIREKFRVAKEGEELVVIVPSQQSTEILAEEKGLFFFLRGLFR